MQISLMNAIISTSCFNNVALKQGRSYRRSSRINDTGPPSYRSPHRIMIQASYASALEPRQLPVHVLDNTLPDYVKNRISLRENYNSEMN
ncbi:hypothetical protein TNCV_3708721 [Trichonephila clavipes]|nr:hypothetical protein TNCV_3708721 [Trichonephila clavipes]